MSSVLLVHHAPAIGRVTRVIPSNAVLDSGTGPPRKGDLGVGTLSQNFIANYGHTARGSGLVTVDSLY